MKKNVYKSIKTKTFLFFTFLFLVSAIIGFCNLQSKNNFVDAETNNDKYITSAYITLNENIVVNYTVAIPVGYTDADMEFIFNGIRYTQEKKDIDSNEVIFSFDKITPQYMSENLEVNLTLSAIGKEDIEENDSSFSIKGYAENLLSKDAEELNQTNVENVKMRTLLVDLLHYGEQSKIYTESESSSPIQDLTNEQKNYKTKFEEIQSTDYAQLGTASSKVAWKGAGLWFDYNVSMYFKFIVKDSVSNLKMKVTKAEDTYFITDFTTETSENEGEIIYTARFNDIKAIDFDKVLNVQLYEGENPIGKMVSYSVKSYIYAKQNDDIIKELAKTTYNYGKSALNYLKAQTKVTSICVETFPNKTEYEEGELFESSGMVVKANYSDGSEETILDYNYSPKTPLTTDIDKITISYGTFTTEVPISVMAVSKLLSISTAPTKTSYKEGENFDATGMVVSLRENGQTRVLSSSEYTILDSENLVVGSQVKVALTSDESIKTKVGITVSSEINVVESMITQAKYNPSHPTLGKYAVNGDYISDFEDKSTLITTVTSASAGKLGLTIKASSSWVSEYSTTNIYWPIKVSDVQANLVFEVYVNGIKVPIADNVKITGGETTDKGGDVSLLAKWTYVTLGNVDFKQGENEVKLVFLPQIYKNADVTSADGYIKEGVYSSPMIDTIKVECFETFGDAVVIHHPIVSEIDLNENHIKGNNTEEWAIAQNRTTAELRNSGSAVVQEALKISKNNNYITNLYGGSRIEVDLGATKSTTGKVVLKASSGYLTAVSWGDSKSQTGDMQFNKIFKVYIRHSDNSTTGINVEDSVVLTGKTGNYSIMANWQEVTFDNLTVNVGDVIVFESLAPKDGGGNYLYKDCGEWGTQSSPNVDSITISLMM